MHLTATVDLSSGTIEYRETDPSLSRRFLGGRGLGAKLLFDRVGQGVAPFAPGNCLIFATGLFSGTPWPAASRYHVTFKSPATGAYGYANAGGHWGPELARAGFDALVVTGQSPEPVYLEVSDQSVAIRPANHLWGCSTTAVHDALLGPAGRTGRNGRLLCIGPAGENRVRFSAILNDYGRAAARGGPGAVMGSKRLKAIRVHALKRTAPRPELARSARQASQHLLNDPKMAGLRTDGTLCLVRPKNLTGDLPAKNHQLGQVPFVDAIDARALNAYVAKRLGCAGCPIRCSRLSLVGDGPSAVQVEGPEYETTDALGPLCWNGDPAIVIRANQLCNEHGLDTISTGVAIAFAMECHEHGLLSDPNLSLRWGDGPTILGLINKIARRDGIGDMLAEGVQRAASVIGQGADAWALHVKGLEMPRQEPRVAKGFGLGHATSNRGADHLYGLPTIDVAGNLGVARQIFPSDMVDKLMEPSDESFKPDLLIYGEHYCAVTDSLGICKFSTTEEYSLIPDDLAAGLRALGRGLTGDTLLEIGERIVNLERLYNVREGLSRAHDRLPDRFLKEPLAVRRCETDSTGKTCLSDESHIARLDNFQAMLDRYYALRGWDHDGRPTTETCARLDLGAEERESNHDPSSRS